MISRALVVGRTAYGGGVYVSDGLLSFGTDIQEALEEVLFIV